jgi:type IV pilus assembly protein PilN
MRDGINLLPWRSKQRHRDNCKLLVILLVSQLLGFALIYLSGELLSQWQSVQASRNQYLSQQIDVVSNNKARLQGLLAEKEHFQSRLKELLQPDNRWQVTKKLLSGISKYLPRGVYFSKLAQADDVIQIEGLALSNAAVSSLMRRLNDVGWVKNTQLVMVRRDNDSVQAHNKFTLTIVTEPNRVEPSRTHQAKHDIN